MITMTYSKAEIRQDQRTTLFIKVMSSKGFHEAQRKKLMHLKAIHDPEVVDDWEVAYHADRIMVYEGICQSLNRLMGSRSDID
jgi:hypothetical protein